MNTHTASTTFGYAVVALVTAALVAALSLSPTTFAQTADVSCSVNKTTVGSNQPVTFTATGGTGNYTWSGNNINIINKNGKQFVVTYPNAGVYPITVTSGGDSATCTMTVVASGGVPAPFTPGLPNTGGGYNR
ncbi:MAG TPA: PKD domain-containing protein [Candidatus Paceibacterota bacterium]